jgi:hypothetical protein
VNSGYVSYREEVSRMHWPLPCMIRFHNSLASSLYDTHPEFIGLIPVCYAYQNSLTSSLYDT